MLEFSSRHYSSQIQPHRAAEHGCGLVHLSLSVRRSTQPTWHSPWRGFSLRSVCLSVFLSNWLLPVNIGLLSILAKTPGFWDKNFLSFFFFSFLFFHRLSVNMQDCVFLTVLSSRWFIHSSCSEFPKNHLTTEASCFLVSEQKHCCALGNLRAGSPVGIQEQKYYEMQIKGFSAWPLD